MFENEVASKCDPTHRCQGAPRHLSRHFAVSELPPNPNTAAPDLEESLRDLEWMEKVKQGDENAFQNLVETHQRRVIAMVARMLGSESEAEDIAQQVFIRVWKSAPKYEATAKFTTWLFTITRNLVCNELRRRKRHPTQSIEASEEASERPFQAADSTTPPPDSGLQNAELQDAIQHAIDRLPEMQRMAILMRRYEEFSYEEIADVLKISVPAVKSVLFRARTDLRQYLKRFLSE
jgi:RNA polymerase sigma-70 factor (ECF subfamily)